MRFEEAFFQGETIEDFYVRPMVKRAWAAQLEILQEINAICKRHNIMYFAEWGTMLGAVRHHGIIPWDDDIDIGMKRGDYERFLYFAEKELPQDLRIVNPYTEEKYGEIMTRITNGPNIDLSNTFLQKYHGCPYVVGIDIFPRDFLVRSKEQQELQCQLLIAANLLAKNWNNDEISDQEKQESFDALLEFVGMKKDENIPIAQQLYQLSDRLCALYGDADADEITQLCEYATKKHFHMPKEWYASTIDMPFGDITIPVPVGYDGILRIYYGENYMTPVKVWGTHDYPFFKNQEEMLKDYFAERGMELPQLFAE